MLSSEEHTTILGFGKAALLFLGPAHVRSVVNTHMRKHPNTTGNCRCVMTLFYSCFVHIHACIMS